MAFTRQQFQEWGAAGGRIRAQRLSKARRKQIARNAGVAPKRPRGRPPGTSRVDPDIAIELYRNGKTLEDIGQHFGVTRERVRQVMAKKGITGADGGQMFRQLLNVEVVAAKKKSALEKKEQRMQKKWGISADEYAAIRKKFGSYATANTKNYRHPISRFVSQRRNAESRNISWGLSFREWWAIWQESGHWERCGRGQGGYVMARWGDSGGYTPENVKIIPAAENNSDRPQKKSGLPIGVRASKNGQFIASKMIAGERYHIGTFSTAEIAHGAYLAFKPKKKAKRA